LMDKDWRNGPQLEIAGIEGSQGPGEICKNDCARESLHAKPKF
jgi:hypothetical protein